MKLRTADDLLDRLQNDVPTLFVVGAAVSTPAVPGSLAMVDRVLAWFEGRRLRRKRARELREEVEALPPHRRYGVAFDAFIETAGMSAANRLVRDVVAEAYAGSLPDEPVDAQWTLTPALRALGRYAALAPPNFARVIVTSNFDPLIEVAVRRAGGQVIRDVMSRDGDLQPRRDDPRVQVVHLHGYWRASDTLHSATQHAAQRLKLAQALKHLCRGHQVVVLGHGGGDDALLQTLRAVALDPSAECDVLWALHGSDPERLQARYAAVFTALAPAAQIGRAFVYAGVDVHDLLPQLADEVAPRPFLDPDRLVARDALLAHLHARIKKRAAVQLVGPAYMGKTAILRQMHRSLGADRRVVHLDARSVARTPAGFVQGIADALGQRATVWQQLCARQAVPDGRDAIDALQKLLPCGVLIDNADELALPGHGFSGGFFDLLRPLIQAGELMWISASRQNLQAQFARTSVSSPFLNDAEVLPVGALEPSVRDALAQTIDDAAQVEAILAEAGPHAVPLTWWAKHWTRGAVPSLRDEFRAWVAPLYAQWWPATGGDVLSARLSDEALDERGRIMARELEAQGLVHVSAAWRAYVAAR